jgi:hypothetical protein
VRRIREVLYLIFAPAPQRKGDVKPSDDNVLCKYECNVWFGSGKFLLALASTVILDSISYSLTTEGVVPLLCNVCAMLRRYKWLDNRWVMNLNGHWRNRWRSNRETISALLWRDWGNTRSTWLSIMLYLLYSPSTQFVFGMNIPHVFLLHVSAWWGCLQVWLGFLYSHLFVTRNLIIPEDGPPQAETCSRETCGRRRI